MKKKSAATKKSPFDPAQIEAIRRLARSGKVADAAARMAALKARHPDYKPLYSLAWEIASDLNRHTAVVAAKEWSEISPNSRAAWQALAEDAFAAGLLALALHASNKLAELDSKPIQEMQDLDTPFGKMRFTEALANDSARMWMRAGRWQEALAAVADFDHVSLRNNAALIRFHQGDITGTLVTFEENWQREPRNLFALQHLIQLRLWTRGRDSAAGLAAPLRATRAERSDDAMAKLNALIMLGDWQGADAAWQESSEADFWQGPRETDLSGVYDYAGALAALRLGNLDAMLERFKMSMDNARPEQQQLIRTIMLAAANPDLSEMPDIPLGELNLWFPQHWVDRLLAMKGMSAQASESYYDALIQTCDAHVDYLCRVAELGGEIGRFTAIAILKQRAKAGDAAARQALIDLLACPCGPDSIRSGLRTWLIDEGMLAAGGTIRMRMQGEVREIKHLNLQIHANPSPSALPPAAQKQVELMFDLVAAYKLDAALQTVTALLDQYPEEPSLYNNLASLKEGLQHPDSEIEPLFEKAHILDPNYLFAISGLARIAARRGDMARAKALVESLLNQESFHFTEWRSILMTQQAMAVQQGETGVALHLRKQLEDLEERFG